jgi:hypothetical protein
LALDKTNEKSNGPIEVHPFDRCPCCLTSLGDETTSTITKMQRRRNAAVVKRLAATLSVYVTADDGTLSRLEFLAAVRDRIRDDLKAANRILVGQRLPSRYLAKTDAITLAAPPPRSARPRLSPSAALTGEALLLVACRSMTTLSSSSRDCYFMEPRS